MKSTPKRITLAGCIGLFIAGLFLCLGGCADSAITADASSLVAQIQKAAPAVETQAGTGSKTAADINAGLWAAKEILSAMQGQPVTAADLDTGIPVVNQVLQKNLGSGNATLADVQKIGSVISALAAPPVPAAAP